MPFLRHARDKRGYETTFVMHSYRPGTGPSAGRTRLLYLFRTPSNRKVGRNLLDPEVMEALEHTHPDLTFDWQGMLRAPAQISGEPERDRERGRGRGDRAERGDRSERANRGEKGDRGERGERQAKHERGSGSDATPGRRQDAPPASEAPLAIVEDESLLGRSVGAQEAARMRATYNELIQRVARRARTPEERDRLTERASRLNPDEWVDAAAVAAGQSTFGVDVEAIRQELPRRRRGRRGGRARDREPGSSGTIGHDAHELEMVGEAGADDRGFDSSVGTDAGADGAADAALHDGD